MAFACSVLQCMSFVGVAFGVVLFCVVTFASLMCVLMLLFGCVVFCFIIWCDVV